MIRKYTTIIRLGGVRERGAVWHPPTRLILTFRCAASSSKPEIAITGLSGGLKAQGLVQSPQ